MNYNITTCDVQEHVANVHNKNVFFCDYNLNEDDQSILCRDIKNMIKNAPKPLALSYWPFSSLSLKSFLESTDWGDIEVSKLMYSDVGEKEHLLYILEGDEDIDLSEDNDDVFEFWDNFAIFWNKESGHENYLFSTSRNIVMQVPVRVYSQQHNGSTDEKSDDEDNEGYQTYRDSIVEKLGFITFEKKVE